LGQSEFAGNAEGTSNVDMPLIDIGPIVDVGVAEGGHLASSDDGQENIRSTSVLLPFDLILLVVDDAVTEIATKSWPLTVLSEEPYLRAPRLAKDHQRAPPRGIARLAVPLKKSLLCTLMIPKPKAAHTKKCAGLEGAERKGERVERNRRSTHLLRSRQP
jgi:hypothetical protein